MVMLGVIGEENGRLRPAVTSGRPDSRQKKPAVGRKTLDDITESYVKASKTTSPR